MPRYTVALTWTDNSIPRDLSPDEVAKAELPASIDVDADDAESACEDAPLNAMLLPAAVGRPELIPVPVSARLVP